MQMPSREPIGFLWLIAKRYVLCLAKRSQCLTTDMVLTRFCIIEVVTSKVVYGVLTQVAAMELDRPFRRPKDYDASPHVL